MKINTRFLGFLVFLIGLIFPGLSLSASADARPGNVSFSAEAQSYVGAWSVDSPKTQETPDPSERVFIFIKPESIASRVSHTHDGTVFTQEGTWEFIADPSAALLIQDLVSVHWKSGDYTFLYKTGTRVSCKFSKQGAFCAESWDRLPTALLTSVAPRQVGDWASYPSKDLVFSSSIQSKLFEGYWLLDTEAKDAPYVLSLSPNGSAELFGRTGSSMGHWFLDAKKLRLHWASGIFAGAQAVFDLEKQRFLRYVDKALKICETYETSSLGNEDAKAMISTWSPPKKKRKAASLQKNSDVASPGYYEIRQSEDGPVLGYLWIKEDKTVLPLGAEGSHPKHSDRVKLDPHKGAHSKEPLAPLVFRGKSGHYRVVARSLLIEWEGGFQELLCPKQNGVHVLESFAPGNFLDEKPLASFILHPSTKEVAEAFLATKE